MKKYIINRTFLGIITILFVLIFVFVSARLTGNPIEIMYPDGLEPGQLEQYNEQFGLDKPIIEQFIIYIRNIFQGDFGISITERRPVEDIILPRIGETLKLGGWALIISVILGLSLGIFTALNAENTFVDLLNSIMSFFYAVPGFVLAITLMYIFSFHLNLLPSQGDTGALSYIMPVTSLALKPTIRICKHVQSAVAGNLNTEYVQTAVSKGIGKNKVIKNHALRNALIPTITVISGVFVDIIAGSTAIEAVFSWPGIGQELISSVLNRDYPVIQFGIILLSILIVVITYVLDILYLFLDPRIGGSEES